MPKSAVVGKPRGAAGLHGPPPASGIPHRGAGGATTVFALSLPAIVGLAGLGTEAASWYLTKRTMQGAADTAASAAALRWPPARQRLGPDDEARSIAARYQFVNGSNGTTVTVNYPYEAIPEHRSRCRSASRQPALLSALFMATGRRSPHAPSRSPISAYEACVIALDKNNETAMTRRGPALSLSRMLALREFSGLRRRLT